MKKYLLILMILVLAYSCKKGPTTDYEEAYALNIENAMTQSEAYKKMKTLCFSCHSPTAEMDMRMAPPMVAVKMHYIKEYANKEDFVNGIWDYMQKPDENKSLMKGAVKRFGLMPYMPYKEQDIKSIASYMYDNELEKPEWFDEHRKKEHGKGRMSKGQGSDKTDKND